MCACVCVFFNVAFDHYDLLLDMKYIRLLHTNGN